MRYICVYKKGKGSPSWLPSVGFQSWSQFLAVSLQVTHTHTRLMALFPGVPGWASTRKVKPIWILLEQETVSGSGISWAICKSAPRSRQITTRVPHHSVFYSLQVMWVINLAVSCHYFLLGQQLPSQPFKRAATSLAASWTQARWVWTVCLRLLPDSVAATIWTQALLCLSPAH